MPSYAEDPTETRAPRPAFRIESYPNPFRRSIVVEFELAQAGPVRISLFDAQGRLVKGLLDRHMEQGRHSLEWGPRRLGSEVLDPGVYFIRMTAGGRIESKKVVVK